jgi:hypothetical protein
MYFKDDEEIIELVRRFESCAIRPEDFRHYQHLTVALWYVREFPYDLAAEKMRTGIRRLATAYGKTGYHETITLFWLLIVREFAARSASAESIWELANRLAASCTGKNVIDEYYSADLLSTPEAKERWVEPDLKSLPRAAESVPSA